LVLSLPFILAFIGSAVALIVGMVIYGDISEAIECPVDGGVGGGGLTNVTSYDNLGTLGSIADATYAEFEVVAEFLPPITGRINEGVRQEGTDSGDSNGEIYLGSTPSTWDFLHNSDIGSEKISINLWIRGNLNTSSASIIVPILTNTCGVFFEGIEQCSNPISGGENGVYLHTRGSPEIPFSETTELPVIVNNSTQMSQEVDDVPSDDDWHMITVLYNKTIGFGKICIDGSSNCGVDGTAGWDSAGSAIHRLTIGSDNDVTQSTDHLELTFEIDDLTFWHGYTLTDTDIDNLFNGGAGASAGSSGLAISVATQKGHWNFDNPTANGVSGGAQVGSEQCQQAKDISWTVIGIIPVALFFSLFAIFSALGTGRQ